MPQGKQSGEQPSRAGVVVLADGNGLRAGFGADGHLLWLESPSASWAFTPSGPGWSLLAEGSAGALEAVRSGDAVVLSADAVSLRLRVESLQHQDGRRFPAALEVHWALREGRLEGRVVPLALPTELTLAALRFPDVGVPYPPGVQWVVPNDLGRVYREPCREHLDDPDLAGNLRQRAHMQFMAWVSAAGSLYLDSRDESGWMRSLLLRVGAGRAQLCIEHLLPRPATGAPAFPPYAVALVPYRGGWYEAARLYRPWALRQRWSRRGPAERRGSYIAEAACWLWNRGRIEEVVPATTEVARRLGLPVALDWYWWHKKPYDTGYPDYFPPRQGEEAFRTAVRELQRQGVAVQVYTNGMSWDHDEPDWPDAGRACTLVKRDGQYWGHVYNTWMNRRLMHVCGAAEGWHRRALQTADGVAALGLDGLYMDQVAIIGGTVPCYSLEHGHTPGGGDYGTAGFRRLLEAIRARHPRLRLSSEGVAEVYQDLLEACISLQTSTERPGEVIPLFPAVYHGHATVFGMYTHLDGITPYDETWPAEFRPDPSRERDWHRLCPDQFALAAARTVAFGCQPTATNLTRHHLVAPEFADDIAFFLDLARFYHARREWLLWGEMLAPGRLEVAEVAVTCITRSIFTRPESIEPFTVRRPAVLHSAWRAEDGQTGMLLINYTREAQHVVIRRDDGLRFEPSDGLTLPPRSACWLTALAAAAPV